ncbi:NAM-like protein [Panicum miliaceum]|uniref:NAM-like protein n=1 Tax=Panicum miliaceum TaxID=4540 RepID=A0A3L6SQJ3_PANMI|nr:NAM-like protein [Panicum miliaceum]
MPRRSPSSRSRALMALPRVPPRSRARSSPFSWLPRANLPRCASSSPRKGPRRAPTLPSLEPPREPRLCSPSRSPAVLAMYRPPRPLWTPDRGAGMWNPPSTAVPFGQDAQGRFDPDAHRSTGEFDHPGVGLMRRRVVPPTSSQVDLLEHEEGDVEEAGTGGTQTGFFTDLMLNEVEESQIPEHTSHPTINEANATAKSSQGRTKNFSTQEDILLVSAWLNMGMDPIQGVDHRAHIGQEYMNISMQRRRGRMGEYTNRSSGGGDARNFPRTGAATSVSRACDDCLPPPASPMGRTGRPDL